MNEKLYKKVSPPFEGGVAGSTYYLTFTKLYFPAGVVDSMISSYLYFYENQNIFNRKILSSSDYLLGTMQLQLRLGCDNQPPRPVSSICIIIKKWSGHPSFKSYSLYTSFLLSSCCEKEIPHSSKPPQAPVFRNSG